MAELGRTLPFLSDASALSVTPQYLPDLYMSISMECKGAACDILCDVPACPAVAVVVGHLSLLISSSFYLSNSGENLGSLFFFHCAPYLHYKGESHMTGTDGAE